MSFLSVDAELSAVGDAGAGVDEDVLDAVFEWLCEWRWATNRRWQVQEFRMSSFHSAGLRVLALASHIDWLATVTDSLLGQTSAEEADWTWVYNTRIIL